MTDLPSLFSEYMHAQGHALDASDHAALVEAAVASGDTGEAIAHLGLAVKGLADALVGSLTAEARKADPDAYQKLADGDDLKH